MTALASTDYDEQTGTASAVQSDHVNVFTVSTGFANAGAAVDANAAAVTAASGTVTADHAEFILVYYNTTNSKVQMDYVSDSGDAAEDHADAVATTLLTFDNIAADGIAAAFAVGDFAVQTLTTSA